MAIAKDIQYTYQRFGVYIDQLRSIATKYKIQGNGWGSYSKFARVIASNREARKEIGALLKVVAALDGGKVTMTTLAMVIALSIGGVGIAAMGTAFGIPAAVLTFLGAVAGALIGNELDDTGATSWVMTKAGVSPADIYLGRDVFARLGSSAASNYRERVTFAMRAREGYLNSGDPSTRHKDVIDVDSRTQIKEALERMEAASSRIETCLQEVKNTQEQSENDARSRSIALKNTLTDSVIQAQKQYTLAHEKLSAEFQSLLAMNSKIESAIEADRMRSLSLQERVNAVHSTVSALANELTDFRADSALKLSRIWLILGIATVILVSTLILNVLVSRKI